MLFLINFIVDGFAFLQGFGRLAVAVEFAGIATQPAGTGFRGGKVAGKVFLKVIIGGKIAAIGKIGNG